MATTRCTPTTDVDVVGVELRTGRAGRSARLWRLVVRLVQSVQRGVGQSIDRSDRDRTVCVTNIALGGDQRRFGKLSASTIQEYMGGGVYDQVLRRGGTVL